MKITLNADLGESWYDRCIGDDAGLMPYLDVCNVACGFHGGDSETMFQTIELAERHGVAVGAHPSFPDRKNFGRTTLSVDDRLFTLLLYQVGALSAMMQAVTGRGLHHLKPHGALYHYADRNALAARAIVAVMDAIGISILIGPPGGELARTVDRTQHTFWAEGFADRVYQPSLHLRPRQEKGACLDDVTKAVAQAAMLATQGTVTTSDGEVRKLRVDTICLHGDHAGAMERARGVREMLDAIPPQ